MTMFSRFYPAVLSLTTIVLLFVGYVVYGHITGGGFSKPREHTNASLDFGDSISQVNDDIDAWTDRFEETVQSRDEDIERAVIAKTVMDYYMSTVSFEMVFILEDVQAALAGPQDPQHLLTATNDITAELKNLYSPYYRSVDSAFPHALATTMNTLLGVEPMTSHYTSNLDKGLFLLSIAWGADPDDVVVSKDGMTAQIDTDNIKAYLSSFEPNSEPEFIFNASINPQESDAFTLKNGDGTPYQRTSIKLEKVDGTWIIVEDISGGSLPENLSMVMDAARSAL